MRGAPDPSSSWQATHDPLYSFSPFAIWIGEGVATAGSGGPADTSFRYTAMARTSASLMCEVELSTTSAIGPSAWLCPLRPLRRYSAISSALHDFSPPRSAPSRRGANQPSTWLPENRALCFAAPRKFFGVWQAPQWP